MKNQIFKKEYIYPNNWDDDDICKFKIYIKNAFDLYSDKLPNNIIEMCVERQIYEEKGLLEPIDHSKIEELEIKTPMYEEFNYTN